MSDAAKMLKPISEIELVNLLLICILSDVHEIRVKTGRTIALLEESFR